MPTASAPGPRIGPDLHPRLHDEALTDHGRLHLRRLAPRAPPLAGGRPITPASTAPSLHPHYRTFTRPWAAPPVPRTGPLPLTCAPPRASLGSQQGTVAPPTRPSLSGRQVLLFRASARDEPTPPLHGHRQGSTQATPGPRARTRAPSSRGSGDPPVLMPSFRLSMRPQWFTHVRLLHPPDLPTAGLSGDAPPPRLPTGEACGGRGSPPARRTRRTYLHHRHSTVRAGDLLHRLTPPFRTHRRTAGTEPLWLPRSDYIA